MKLKALVNPVLYAVALAMSVAILILSFVMDFSCAVNLRYFIFFLAIAIFCLAAAGVNVLKNSVQLNS